MKINLGGLLRGGSKALIGARQGRSEAMSDVATRTMQQRDRDMKERAQEQEYLLNQARVSNEELRARALADNAADPDDLDAFEAKEKIRAKYRAQPQPRQPHIPNMDERWVTYRDQLIKQQGLPVEEANKRADAMYPRRPSIDLGSLFPQTSPP